MTDESTRRSRPSIQDGASLLNRINVGDHARRRAGRGLAVGSILAEGALLDTVRAGLQLHWASTLDRRGLLWTTAECSVGVRALATSGD